MLVHADAGTKARTISGRRLRVSLAASQQWKSISGGSRRFRTNNPKDFPISRLIFIWTQPNQPALTSHLTFIHPASGPFRASFDATNFTPMEGPMESFLTETNGAHTNRISFIATRWSEDVPTCTSHQKSHDARFLDTRVASIIVFHWADVNFALRCPQHHALFWSQHLETWNTLMSQLDCCITSCVSNDPTESCVCNHRKCRIHIFPCMRTCQVRCRRACVLVCQPVNVR